MTTSGEEWDSDDKQQPSRLRGALSFHSKDVGGYRVGKTLGKGSCAVVKLGIHRETGKHAAIKILKPRTLREQKEALREVEALQRLNHPNITRMYQVIRENGYTCIILELSAGGELFDYVMNAGKLDEEEARFMFRQICSGLQYCHANLVAHRDLKPENLLLDEFGNIKISDFGLSNVLKPGRLFSTWCGSPVYTPPEVVLRQQYCGITMDIWSLGVVLYVLVTGGMPWRLESNVVKNMDDLIVGNYDIPDFLGVSDSCRELIGTMLVANSTKRATLESIMNHRWTCEGYDGPPDAHLEPKPLVTHVNEPVFSQLAGLGFDLTKARAALATNTTSPALSAYHNLLTKHQRAQKVKGCQAADAALVNSPVQFLQTVTRTRSKTYSSPPPTRSPLAFRKEGATGNAGDLTPVHAPLPAGFTPPLRAPNFRTSAPVRPSHASAPTHTHAHKPVPPTPTVAPARVVDVATAVASPPFKKDKGMIRSFFDKFKKSSLSSPPSSPSKKQSGKSAKDLLATNYTTSNSTPPQPPRHITMVVEQHNSPSPTLRRRL